MQENEESPHAVVIARWSGLQHRCIVVALWQVGQPLTQIWLRCWDGWWHVHQEDKMGICYSECGIVQNGLNQRGERVSRFFTVVGVGAEGFVVWLPLSLEGFVWLISSPGWGGRKEWRLKGGQGSTSENEVRLFIMVGSTQFSVSVERIRTDLKTQGEHWVIIL